MDRVTILRFEKLNYFRSLPSCAWLSAHRASIRGLFGRLLATSGACCQSSFPATIEAVSPRGAFHDSGSSSTNSCGGSTFPPSPFRKFHAKRSEERRVGKECTHRARQWQ